MRQFLPMMRAPVLIALLVAALFAQESLATRFSGHRDHVNNLLGSSDLADLNLQTGFVDFSESRLNIYGERSSVFYHLKPHVTKLKVRVDHSCFEVKCSTGKVILTERSDRPASWDELHGDCLHSSVSSLTSSTRMTGRSLTYNQKRPSLNDVRSGDLLHGDMKCRDATHGSGSFKIASIYQKSDTSIGSSKRIYEINVQPAVISDIVSEGEYEFHTENLLTVNALEHPHALDQSFHTRNEDEESSDTWSTELVNLNWNFNQEAGQASKSLNIWQAQKQVTASGNGGFSGTTTMKASVDCVSCFAQFKASATIKYQLNFEVSWWLFIPYPSLNVRFMAEVSIRAIANIDLKFKFDYAAEYEYSKQLASITPMLDQALASFNILGFPLTLGITYGLDISIGVSFSAKADLEVTVGADVQCNYKFGVYHNYNRPTQPNGCSRSYHTPRGRAAGSIEVVPFILFEPYVKVGFGDALYGKAVLAIKPQVVFSLSVAPRLSVNVVLELPISFKFVVGYSFHIIAKFSDEWTLGPFEIAKLRYQLLSTGSHDENQIRSLTSSVAPTSDGRHDVGAHILSAEPNSAEVSCTCITQNVTMHWQAAESQATVSTSTINWQVMNGTLVDTCDYTAADVDAVAMLFTAPAMGYYHVKAEASAFVAGNSWNVFARVGPGCCGSLIFCASISAENPTWSNVIFLNQDAVLSLVWTSDSAGSDASITVTISSDPDPVVYVDLVYGLDSDDGTYASPVETLEKGLAILATRISARVKSATIVMNPTLYTYLEMSPSTRSGFVFPDILKTVDLTIKSMIERKASAIYEAYQSTKYCNYQVQTCVSKSSFYDSVYGTSYDTEVLPKFRDDSRAFNLTDFKSITLEGLWIQGFSVHDDGAAIYAKNSKVTIKNCFFVGNKALKRGRGAAVFSLNSSISIQHSVFYAHESKGNGGILYAGQNSNVDIQGSFFEDSLSDGEGGMIFFDASQGSALTVTASKFWISSSVAGAGIALYGGRSNAVRNKIIASDFSGLAAATIGGSILTKDSNLDLELSSFINTFSVSGASSLESYSSQLSLASNDFNFTGAPQLAIAVSTSYSDSASYFGNGGQFCPLAHCTPTRIRNGECDPICNISMCLYDGGDCLCDVNTCPSNLRGDGVCDVGCASSGCQYDFGDCCDVSACTFDMRNNSICDHFCNSKACGYDDGDCPIPDANPSAPIVKEASAHVTQSENRFSKKHPVSILRTAESPVLIAIKQYSDNLIRQRDSRAGDFSSSTYVPTSSPPTSISCSRSSVNAPTSFIDAGDETNTVKSDSCTGLATCSSCGVCGLCKPQGCDTSFFDSFCQKIGPSWKCTAVTPSKSNNFSVTACIDTAASKPAGSDANQNTSSQSMSPGAIAGITIAVLIAVACAVAVAVYAFRRRVPANTAAVDGIGLVEVQVGVEQGTMRASANGTSSQDRDVDTNAQRNVTAPPPVSTAGSDSQLDAQSLPPYSPSASAAKATAGTGIEEH